MPDEPRIPKAGPPPGRRRRAWLWFAGGFLVVFVAMSVAVSGYAMSPRGDAVVVAPLWQPYRIEIERAFGPSTLGPASGSSSGVLTAAALHLVCSAAGGAAALAVRWAARRVRR